MNQFVVQITIIGGRFNGWKGFAFKQGTRIAVNLFSLAAKLTQLEAQELAESFNSYSCLADRYYDVQVINEKDMIVEET